MARRLLASGFRLTAFDLLLERTNSLVEFGATGADSPQGACQDAEALVLMVADAAQAEDALFGEKGAVQALTPGAAVILMSTVGRDAVRQLDDRLTARELRVLDAPVSGASRELRRAICSSWREGSETCSMNSARFWNPWDPPSCTAASRQETGKP
jgi:3-hydroxyisobutyrate dehydrogenase-like beta-hydroxyacid dehydrogenase